MKTWTLIPAAMLLASCGSPGLKACDAAIQETLKAPATYNRVSVSGEEGDWNISYDAANSFNTPIRGSGHCAYVGGTAFWRPDPRER